VTVALALLLNAVVVALNAAVTALAATVTDAGTVRVALLLDRLTFAPPVGAAWVRVTVQVLEAFGPRLAGLQDNDDIKTGAKRLTIVLAEAPLYEAVTVALELPLNAVVLALKVAEVAAAATVTDAGTVRVALLLDRLMLAPPVGAAWVSVTVQVLEAFDPRLAGLHAKEGSNTGATRLRLAVAELLL
jgi:hypothetical protein